MTLRGGLRYTKNGTGWTFSKAQKIMKHPDYSPILYSAGDKDVNECGILVDDLFDEYLVDLFGENAAQAINVYCKGYILYPIDPAKTKQDISKKLSVPAAFVPEGVDVGP